MRTHLQVAVLVIAIAAAPNADAARHWPDPPASWLHSSTMRCIRNAESGNGTTSCNIYQLQGPRASGNYGDYEWMYGHSRAEQDYRAWLLYQRQGCHDAWGRYDGCC